MNNATVESSREILHEEFVPIPFETPSPCYPGVGNGAVQVWKAWTSGRNYE